MRIVQEHVGRRTKADRAVGGTQREYLSTLQTIDPRLVGGEERRPTSSTRQNGKSNSRKTAECSG